MNVNDWYTLRTDHEVITGQIVEVNASFFRIKQGSRTRAFNIGHVVALNPIEKFVGALNHLPDAQNAPSERVAA